MTATFHVGDAIEVMSKLPDKSVDLVLTSPPFLALRSYLPADHPDKALEGGSQATPGIYIDWLIDVVEACDRVLAPHGSLCIELGDTYSNGENGGPVDGERNQAAVGYDRKFGGALDNRTAPSSRGGTGWPLAKSLSLIPELFRLTLVYGTNPLTGRTTDRWRLRNVVRWVRPNPPVGALGDKFRPATSELMVFCKSAKRYFDLDAVREPHKETNHRGPVVPGERNRMPKAAANEARRDGEYTYNVGNPAGAPPLDWWNIPLLEGEEETRYGPKPRDITKGIPNKALAHSPTKGNSWGPNETKIMYENPAGAPPLDWWRIPQMSTLRDACEHGRYDQHYTYARPEDGPDGECPGGEYVTTSGAPLDWWNIPPRRIRRRTLRRLAS